MQCTMQMQCTLTEVQLSEVKMWTIAEYCRLGDEAERRGKGKTKLGVKQKPWWDFIPITHYMVPLLHCMIGVGNQLLDMLRDIIKEHLENMTHTKERILASIPLLKKTIAKTAVNRNSFDDSDDGKLLKKLKRNVTLHSPLLSVSEASATNNSATIAIAIAADVAPATAAYANANSNSNDTNTETDEINLRTLDEFRNRDFVEKISKARKMLTDQKLKLKTMRTSKVKDQQSIETKIFKVVKEIGVELSTLSGK